MNARIRRGGTALATSVAATLALTACGGGAGAGTGSAADDVSASTSSPVDGGELTFAIGNDPISLNPSGTGSGNDTLYVTRQIVDSLLYQNPDTNELEPWLATSWSANADATTFTFELRDDVTFSDGTPLTAAEVKGTFDDIVAAGAKSGALSSFVGYEGTNVIDDDTVEVDFATPNAAFPSSTASPALGIVAASTVAIPFDDRATGEGVVGTGPFVLESYTKDVETVLAQRAEYAWAPSALGNDGAPHLEKVTFQVVPEAGVRTGSLTSDQVDVAGGIQPTDIETLETSGFPVISRANPGNVFGVYFNNSRPIVSDVEVREAISFAIDAEEIRDTSLNGSFAVATSVLASTTPGWADQSSYFAFDRAKAEKLLDQAGWTVGSDGVREKDGQKLSLKVAWITNFGPNQTSLELLQQQLKAVGIEITLEGGTVPEFLERQQGGDYDFAWHNQSRADGDILRTAFSTGATNYPRITDPELEALLQAQLAAGDPAERAEILAQAQERLASQYYQIPVHELTSVIGTQPTVHGLTFGADSRLDSLVSTWKDAD
ncbi:ABC transporter substrate-binding protein [Oerskovia enterophila]|uniref:Nickel-binding periplasmic protein n=1 Tax=Oerskovia enterophila TaxID=43678 RepID=A0A163QRR5_9CELL|nr:ABC transporter substrate-binding protein [Oerskovia enterophila]KZM34455.1 nickel-binding periplasmic protein precursor [Oerskovia enterophila]